MSDAGRPGPLPDSETLAALIEAIDARARQAGSDGAAMLTRGILGSVSEALANIEQRLVRIEAADSETADGVRGRLEELGRLLEQRASAGPGDGEAIARLERGIEERLARLEVLAGSGAEAGARVDDLRAVLVPLGERLGRLEEAFVQAVEESSTGAASVVEEVGRVVSAAIASASVPGAADQATAIARVEAQLGRLEQWIATTLPALQEQATAASEAVGAAASAAEAAAAASLRADGLAEAVEAARADLAEGLTSSLEAVRASLAEGVKVAVEAARVSLAGEIRQTAATSPVAPAIDPELADQLRRLAAAPPAIDPELADQLRRLAAAPPAIDPELADQLRRLAAAPPAIEPELADQLRKLVAGDVLASEASFAQVEERLNAAIRAVLERAESARQSVEILREEVGDDRVQLDAVFDLLKTTSTQIGRLPVQLADATVERLSFRFETLTNRLDAVDITAAKLEQAVTSVRERLELLEELQQSLAAASGAVQDLKDMSTRAAPVIGGGAEIAERITDALHREAELLTQRVAALAVGVEATRSLLEQHVEETETSLGRRATEVTRRLAADFGLRSKRGRRESREIGPGR